jgi:D-inositol-3-phosphate glycosyltransferase
MLSVHTSPLAPLGGKKTGGMNVYVRELAETLGAQGIEVDIYTRKSAPDQPEVDVSLGANVRVIHVPCGPAQILDPDAVYPYLSQFTAGMFAFIAKDPVVYDIIYSHYWLSGWVANKLKEVWNIPIVQMFHTLGHMKNRISAVKSALPDVRIGTERQIVDWADVIVAATPAEYNQLLWLYHADRRKIAIIPPGVKSEMFKPIPQAVARQHLGIDEACQLLLFVGRIEPLKAVDTILEALSLIKNNHPQALEKVCFAVVGGNPQEPDGELERLMVMVGELGLGCVVEFLGAKSHEMLPYYYASATAVIMPSDYESFGMVALEAMASGTPVIASEVGGLAFLVQDGETGYLVPVRDPQALSGRILALVTDGENRRRMGENAVHLARQYDWSAIADQLLQLFNDQIRRNVPMVVSLRKNFGYLPPLH